MKTKSIILSALLLLNAASCQAGILGAIAITAWACVGYHAYQAGGDSNKTIELMYETKDAAINFATDTITNNCTTAECKKIAELLAQCKQTPEAKAKRAARTKLHEHADAAFNAAEKAMQDMQLTATYKKAEKACNQFIHQAQNQLSEISDALKKEDDTDNESYGNDRRD